MGDPLCHGTSRHKQVPLLGSCQSWDLCICLEYCTVWLIWCSVTHLLGNLMRVKDTRDRHLDFVFLLLGLTERRLPLLQKQVRCVLTCKLLEQQQRMRRHKDELQALHLTYSGIVARAELFRVLIYRFKLFINATGIKQKDLTPLLFVYLRVFGVTNC